MKAKMINLFYLAKECKKDILEIGFNAGNSCLIFLLANPNVKIHAVDICIHAYVQPCVDFLNRMFNNRVILHKGNSLEVVPKLDRFLGDTIDLYHIDGWHALEGIQADMKNCYDLAKNGSFLVVDDVNVVDILNEAKKYEMDNKITPLPEKIIRTPPCFPHLIYSYNK
jgi:predicted O-methyltransferase YrrM